MIFAAPQMFWLLPALVLPLILFFWWAWRKRQKLITQFISLRLINQLKVGVSAVRQKIRMGLIVVALTLAIVALARPQWGKTLEEARLRGLDIIVAIDVSNSMLAQDISPYRLARAKLAALDLVHHAKTDRMGLVAFAGMAFLECPLTLDDAAFSQSVDALDTQSISQGGTAIAEAINEAAKAFKKESDNHKVLVLFTDGEDHDSEAVPAAEKAAEQGILIFTVGLGTPEGELLRIQDERKRVDYIRDDQGKPVKSHLNEELLQKIAAATKGFYLPLRDTKTIDMLYDRGIAPLPKTETATRLFQTYQERFHWPLGAAMVLLVLEMFLPDRKRKRRKPASTEPATASATAGTVAILLLLLLPGLARADGSSSALREYNQGKYDDALKQYNKLLERTTNDPRLHFNAGAAAYQGRKLNDAITQFKEALKSPDLDMQQRAYYNLANTYYRMGEEDPDNSKKKEDWENALKQYTNALALNKQDADAGFNRDFVQRQIEELKKQEQQSQSQNNEQKKDEEKDDKQDQKKDSQQNEQSKQDQSKQDQQKKEQQKQDQNSQAQNQQRKQQDDQKKDDPSQAQNQQKSSDEKKDQKQASAGKPGEKSDEEKQREAAMMAAGQMTPEQALQLLESLKDDAQVLRLAPPNKNTATPRDFKNW